MRRQADPQFSDWLILLGSLAWNTARMIFWFCVAVMDAILSFLLNIGVVALGFTFGFLLVRRRKR